MEDLAPPLKFVIALRMAIENGQSIQRGTKQFVDEFPQNSMSLLLECWFAGAGSLQYVKNSSSHATHWTPWRQMVLDVLAHGWRGAPILEDIKQLEVDLTLACEDQIGLELQRLPFIALVPVLLFQFPAYLVLLLGPWLSDLFYQIF